MATTETAAASPRTAPGTRVVLGLLAWVVAAALVIGGAYSLLDVGARHTSQCEAPTPGSVRSSSSLAPATCV